MELSRRKLKGPYFGDRQMVRILDALLYGGLATLRAACAQALEQNVHSAEMILNLLARQRDPHAAINIMTPDAPKLINVPPANCAHYDMTCNGFALAPFNQLHHC